MTRKLIAVLFMALVFTGCTTIDPYTREEKISNTAKGAGIGAASGAIIGAIAGGGEGAAIGAAAGAALGSGIGYYMDQQEAELRQRLEATGVRVVRAGDSIQLVLPGNITFATDSYNVREEFVPVLDSIAVVLKKYKNTRLRVVGHTDSTGSARYNQLLSERRAQAVKDTLVSLGIPATRIVAMGMGETSPIASNATAAGRAQNRRVEILIEPI